MLHSGNVVGAKKHEILSRDVKLTNAVQHDMAVDVTCPVVTITVSADDDLMSGKCFSSKLHTERLSLLGGESVFVPIVGIEAHDVVVSLDLAKSVVLVELLVYSITFDVESIGIAVNAFHEIKVSRYHSAVLVEDRFVRKLVMPHRQIIGCCAVIGVVDIDVFNSRHDIHLPVL